MFEKKRRGCVTSIFTCLVFLYCTCNVVHVHVDICFWSLDAGWMDFLLICCLMNPCDFVLFCFLRLTWPDPAGLLLSLTQPPPPSSMALGYVCHTSSSAFVYWQYILCTWPAINLVFHMKGTPHAKIRIVKFTLSRVVPNPWDFWLIFETQIKIFFMKSERFLFQVTKT